MKHYIRGFFIFFIIINLFNCQTTQTTVDVPENVDLPYTVQFLSQSCDASSLYQTVIDLSNNELVVLEYSAGILSRVYRTGIKIDPKRHRVVKGSDAPFIEEPVTETEENR